MISSESLIDVFNKTAKTYADDVAVINEGRRYTFADMKILSDNVAVHLVSKGIDKGDRIALYCINSVNFAIAYMAIVKAGAVVVPLNLLQKPSEIAYVLNNAAVSGLLYHELFQENVDELSTLMTADIFDICIGSHAGMSSVWNSVLETPGSTVNIDIDAVNDLAAILYLSLIHI